MEPGWEMGVCKRKNSPKIPDEPNNEKNNGITKENNMENNNELQNGFDDVCNYAQILF